MLRFAKTYGFEVVGGSRDGMDVQVRAPLARSKPHSTSTCAPTSIRQRTAPSIAPDREPTVDLPFNLWHISGLDNYSIPHPMCVNKE